MVLAIYGSGSVGREITQLVNEMSSIGQQYQDMFFVDDTLDKNGKSIDGLKCITFADVERQYKDNECVFVVGVGEPKNRQLIYNRIKDKGYSLITLIHPSVFLPNSVVLGEGVVINKYTIISIHTEIRNNSYIQPQASIGHDVVIGENCVISTHSTISGHCCIGDNSYVAINVPIREGVTIGNNCIVGMGSIITKDVPNDTITAGATGRVVPRPKNKLVFK